MATTTPNYGWTVPTSTDLVKDGATAIETLGDAIDATLFNGLRIKQIVSANYSTQVSSATNTFVDTGLSVTITPTSVNNTIFIFVNQNGLRKTTNNTWINLKLLRGATSLYDLDGLFYTNNSNENGASANMIYYDNPATTSATTYKTQINSGANNATVFAQIGSGKSLIYAVEVGK